MNEQLIPQQRTDKNGKVTTRWVKPDGAPVANGREIPRPSFSLQEKVSRQSLILAAAESCARTVDTGAVTFDELFATTVDEFEQLATPTVALLADLRGKEWRYWQVRECIDNDEGEAFLVDYLELAEHIENNTDSADENIPYVRMLSHYPSLHPHIVGDEYPALRREQATGIISVTGVIEELIANEALPEAAVRRIAHEYDFTKTTVIADERISDLIISRPDDGMRIAEFIQERETLDYDRIVEWLDADAPAVSSGLL